MAGAEQPVYNHSINPGTLVSHDGRRRFDGPRERPIELPRSYQDVVVEIDGVKVPMVRSHYRGPYHSFFIQERATHFDNERSRAKVYLGDGGGFVIRGAETIHEIVFGDDPTRRNDNDASRFVLETYVENVTVNNGAVWVWDHGHVENMLIAGPGEIFTPGGEEGDVDKYIAHRRVEGYGFDGSLNNRWLRQGPIKYKPA